MFARKEGTTHGRYRRRLLVPVSHRRNAPGHHVGHELRSVAVGKTHSTLKGDSHLSCERVSYVMGRDRLGNCGSYSFVGRHSAVVDSDGLLGA